MQSYLKRHEGRGSHPGRSPDNPFSRGKPRTFKHVATERELLAVKIEKQLMDPRYQRVYVLSKLVKPEESTMILKHKDFFLFFKSAVFKI